jgi:hypothetical protein
MTTETEFVTTREIHKTIDKSARNIRFARRLASAGLVLPLAACSTPDTVRQSADSSVTVTAQPSPSESAGGGSLQEVSQFGADVFRNYQDASGKVGRISIGDTAVVACLIFDPNSEITSTRGLWYRLGSNKTSEYAAANTFWNQPSPEPPDEGNAYDPRVEVCSDSPSDSLPDPHHPQ